MRKETIPIIIFTNKQLTWLGGICFPLRRSSRRVPKLYITLSGVTLPINKDKACEKKSWIIMYQVLKFVPGKCTTAQAGLASQLTLKIMMQ